MHWLDRYIEDLQEMRDRLNEGDQEDLFSEIAQSEMDYSSFLLGAVGRKNESDAASEADMFDFNALMIGQLAKDKISEMTESSEARLRKDALDRRMKRDIH